MSYFGNTMLPVIDAAVSSAFCADGKSADFTDLLEEYMEESGYVFNLADYIEFLLDAGVEDDCESVSNPISYVMATVAFEEGFHEIARQREDERLFDMFEESGWPEIGEFIDYFLFSGC